MFLAGDAAHVHSPTGGQGMNLGLQDAFNLGWKLGEYLRGEAGEELLDSYHDERHPVGAAVLANTRAQGVLMIPDDDVACLRETLAELLKVPAANQRLAEAISGIGVAYARRSSVGRAPADGSGAGGRFDRLRAAAGGTGGGVRPGRGCSARGAGGGSAGRICAVGN